MFLKYLQHWNQVVFRQHFLSNHFSAEIITVLPLLQCNCLRGINVCICLISAYAGPSRMGHSTTTFSLFIVKSKKVKISPLISQYPNIFLVLYIVYYFILIHPCFFQGSFFVCLFYYMSLFLNQILSENLYFSPNLVLWSVFVK